MFGLFAPRPTISPERMAADRLALATATAEGLASIAAERDTACARESRGQRVTDNGITWVG